MNKKEIKKELSRNRFWKKDILEHKVGQVVVNDLWPAKRRKISFVDVWKALQQLPEDHSFDNITPIGTPYAFQYFIWCTDFDLWTEMRDLGWVREVCWNMAKELSK